MGTLVAYVERHGSGRINNALSGGCSACELG